MKSKLKRYITFVLSIAMIVTMIPSTFVMAEDVDSSSEKGQVSFNTSSGGSIRVWDNNGNEYVVQEDNNDLLLEYEAGTTIHTEVKNKEGYEVATYKIVTDSGSETDLLSAETTDIVITKERQEIVATFNEVKQEKDTSNESTKTEELSESKSEEDSKQTINNNSNTIQAGSSIITKSSAPMKALANNGISVQADGDPVITLNVYNLSGTLWKTFTYAVPTGSRFSIDQGTNTEDNTVDLISAIEKESDDANPYLSLSEADITTLTNLLNEADSKNMQATYYNSGTTLALKSDFNVSSSMTLDVKFERSANVILTINYNNDTEPVEVKLNTGDSPMAYKPNDPTKKDCIFDDWYDAETGDLFDWSANMYVDKTVEALYDMDTILDEAAEMDEDDVPDKITNVNIKLGKYWNISKNAVGSHTAWKATITKVGGSDENKKWARVLGLTGKTFKVQCVSPGKSRASYGKAENVTVYIDKVKIYESGIIRYNLRLAKSKKWARNNGIVISNQGQRVYFSGQLQNTLMGKFRLQKESTLPDLVKENPNYSLKGAEFTIYKGQLKSGTDVSGKKSYGTLITKEDGSTDASKALTPGKYTVVETKSSEGHSKYPEITENCTVDSQGRRLFNNIVVTASLPSIGEDDENDDEDLRKIPCYDVPNSPQMDPWNLAVRKFNKESGFQVNAGNGHFDVEYKMSYYYTKNMTEAQCRAIQPDRVWYFKPDPITGNLMLHPDYLVKSKSDSLYFNEEGNVAIPIGTLTVTENSTTQTGYKVENTVFKTTDSSASINGNFVLYHINGDVEWRPVLNVLHTTESHNDVRRGDLKFVKVRSEDMTRLANVPFKITSLTTGESHIIVTDVNGEANTSSAWATRGENVNKGQSYDDGIFFTGYGPTTVKELDEEGNKVYISESELNQLNSAVWNTYSNVTDRDKVGALPYDSYRIEEQRCAANEGDKLVSFVATIGEKHDIATGGKPADMGTLDDLTPSMFTTARDTNTLSKEVVASGEVEITDTITYDMLTRGKKYVAKGTWMDKETGKALIGSDGEPITETKSFTAYSPFGSVDVNFKFDASSILEVDENGIKKAKDIVCFERIYEEGTGLDSDKYVAKHEEIDDEGQTVTLKNVEIKTTAMGKDSQTNEVGADEKATIIDIVKCNGLVKGKEYELKGTLMDKETGEPLIANDKQVTATKVVYSL